MRRADASLCMTKVTVVEPSGAAGVTVEANMAPAAEERDERRR